MADLTGRLPAELRCLSAPLKEILARFRSFDVATSKADLLLVEQEGDHVAVCNADALSFDGLCGDQEADGQERWKATVIVQSIPCTSAFQDTNLDSLAFEDIQYQMKQWFRLV